MPITIVEKTPSPEVVIPDTVSKLLKAVVSDMKVVGQLKNVSFDMADWIAAAPPYDRCTVCAAGAWLYMQISHCFNNSTDMERWLDGKLTSMDSPELNAIMHAIDMLRTGAIRGSLEELDEVYGFMSEVTEGKLVEDLGVCFSPTYNPNNPRSVVAAFEKCVKVLEQYEE